MEVLVLVLVVQPPNTLSAASFNTRMEAYGVPSMYYELASLLRSLFLCWRLWLCRNSVRELLTAALLRIYTLFLNSSIYKVSSIQIFSTWKSEYFKDTRCRTPWICDKDCERGLMSRQVYTCPCQPYVRHSAWRGEASRHHDIEFRLYWVSSFNLSNQSDLPCAITHSDLDSPPK